MFLLLMLHFKEAVVLIVLLLWALFMMKILILLADETKTRNRLEQRRRFEILLGCTIQTQIDKTE